MSDTHNYNEERKDEAHSRDDGHNHAHDDIFISFPVKSVSDSCWLLISLAAITPCAKPSGKYSKVNSR